MPTALAGVYGVDFRTESIERYKELVRHLHRVNEVRPIGGPPDWLRKEFSLPKEYPVPSLTSLVERSYVSAEDLPLIIEKRGSGFVVWLKNDTLDPIDRCGIGLTNLQQYSISEKDFYRNPFSPIALIRPHTLNAGNNTKEAATLAGTNDPSKLILTIAQSFSFQSALTLMAELSIQGNGNSRNETFFISWSPGEDPRLIEDPRSSRPELIGSLVAPHQYWEERQKLPDSALIKKIWQVPRWCIWSRPEEFRKARFRDLDHCAQFVASASVRSNARWSQYPWFSGAPEQDEESISNGIDITEDSIKHLERWVLFQSGQFIDNMALDAIPQLGDRTHVLEILDTTTAVFEFLGRMADRKVLSDQTAIAFELKQIAGRQLTWPQDITRISDRVNVNAWCQNESITIDSYYSAHNLINHRRTLALDVAFEIYSQFGWTDPPKKELEAMQNLRFGQPLHL